MYCHSLRTNHKFWPFLGTIGVKKGQKMLISLKVTTRDWKFVQRNNFWYCHSFRTNHNFWPFLGHPKVQMRVQKGQKLPIPLIITHKSWKSALVIFHEKFDPATQWGSKWKKFVFLQPLSWISGTLACSNVIVTLIFKWENNLPD